MESCHRCGVGLAAEHRSAGEGSRAQMLTQVWWALASAERRRYGQDRSGRRSEARPGGAAVRCSMAGLLEEQTSRVPKGWLYAAVGLETVALDTHSLDQTLDESLVTPSQELAVAG